MSAPLSHHSALLSDESATEAFGAALAAALRPGLLIALNGDLGAGKTTLVRGVLRALGHQGAVRSPTYALVESYETPDFPLYHFDLYRLGEPEELEYMGIRDYLTPDSIAFIEWPQRGKGILPQADLVVTLAYSDTTTGRRLEIDALSKKGADTVAGLPTR